MSKKNTPIEVSIGKFDILTTYVYAHALLSGLSDDDAKQRGMVAAIMGAQARLGVRKEHYEEFRAQKEAAEKKKKTPITAESFDKQVADKMGFQTATLFMGPGGLKPRLISRSSALDLLTSATAHARADCDDRRVGESVCVWIRGQIATTGESVSRWVSGFMAVRPRSVSSCYLGSLH